MKWIGISVSNRPLRCEICAVLGVVRGLVPYDYGVVLLEEERCFDVVSLACRLD